VTVDEIKRQALKLDPSTRASLPRDLLSSLDDLSEAEVERLWLEEAARRNAEVRAGKAATSSMEEVLAKARAKRA
jgi:hypothetical protein